MKKNRLFMMAGALCAALGLGSCSNEMDEVAVPAEGATRTVTLTVSLPDRGADTRTAYATDGAGLKVTWAEGDKLTAVYDNNFAKSTTFTLTSGAGETTATFTGELPEDVNDGVYVEFTYPELKTEVIDGETHYIYQDYRTQDGTLAGLSKVDAFSFIAQYSGGKLTSTKGLRHSSFLHFAKGTQVASASGTATFTISRAVAAIDLTADTYIIEDIVVSNVTVNTDGTLADDVYIAFEIADTTPTLTIAVGSETKAYSLDKEFQQGMMYNISDLSKLTVAPQVGMVIGSDGKYYATASDVPSGVTAEAMIAYLGKLDGVCDKGLAIALQDAASYVTWANAESNVSTWASSHAVTGGTWRLPSAYDWQLMLIGCGSTSEYVGDLTDQDGFTFVYGNIRTMLEAAGGIISLRDYWSSTEYDSNNAWGYYFNSLDGKFWFGSKTSLAYIRAVLAF